MTRTWFAILMLCVLVPSKAMAWETYVDEDSDGKTRWTSIYYCTGKAKCGYSLNPPHPHEHLRISDLSLEALGARVYAAESSVLGTQRPFRVIDLNASLFRRQALAGTSTEGDDPQTPLEERIIPPPSQFCGLPDFSFTVYDWINKNSDALCPAVPGDGNSRDTCHVFSSWIGAVLNATHFGEHAKASHGRLHAIALRLADRAKRMREALEPEGLVEAYRDYLTEAELEALAYEGVAQHFLQDRWSTGHMWNRWNAADYDHLAYSNRLVNAAIGIIAGLLHGSEGVRRGISFVPQEWVPDPLCSPLIPSLSAKLGLEKLGLDNTPQRITWKLSMTSEDNRYAGVGDWRLDDLEDGQFGAEYNIGNHALHIETQKKEMMTCTEASWADVIGHLGSGTQGGYGVWGVAARSTGMPGTCLDPWVTNAAIKKGWVKDEVVRGAGAVEGVLRSALAIKGSLGPAVALLRTPLTEVTWRVRNEARLNPHGTTLAQGGIGNFGQAQPGHLYPMPPPYFEPVDFAQLPDEDSIHGRDKQSVFGFFNRAHTDYWCRQIEETLRPWRESEKPEEQAACLYLADRVYQGTDPSYHGRQAEVRTLDGTQESAQIAPVCSIYQVDEDSEAPRESMPYFLEPGYVAFKDDVGPYQRSKHNETYQSIEHWCARVPVFTLFEAEQDEDVVASVEHEKQSMEHIEVTGHHFGDTEGTLSIGKDPHTMQPVKTTQWTDTAITFQLSLDDYPLGDYFLALETSAPRRTSVGRFIVRIKRPVPYLRQARFQADGNVYYDASWQKPEEADTRTLQVRVDAAVDTSIVKTGVAWLAFSRPMEQVILTVGSFDIQLAANKDRTVFRGTVPVAQLPKDTRVPWQVNGMDKDGDLLDGDPRTIAVQTRDGTYEGYEHQPDRWHAISTITGCGEHGLEGFWQAQEGYTVRIRQPNPVLLVATLQAGSADSQGREGFVSFRATAQGRAFAGPLRVWKPDDPSDPGIWTTQSLTASEDCNTLAGDWVVPRFYADTGALAPRSKWGQKTSYYTKIQQPQEQEFDPSTKGR